MIGVRAGRLAVAADMRTSPRVCLQSFHIAAPTRRTSRAASPITCATASVERQVFLDTGSIPAGADFRHTIQQALRRRGVLVAIVGPEWMAARHGAPERINDPDDPVRMEIATALAEGLPIIPVLVNDASMPSANELPDDIKDFAYRNALTVDRGRFFHRDADELVREVEALHPRRSRRRIAAALLAAAALAAAWVAVPYFGRDAVTPGVIPTASAPASDVEVASFRTADGRPELDFVRQKVERNFVDLFSDAKLRVRASLTTNQSLAQAHFTLGGAITEHAGHVIITAELRNARGTGGRLLADRRRARRARGDLQGHPGSADVRDGGRHRDAHPQSPRLASDRIGRGDRVLPAGAARGLSA